MRLQITSERRWLVLLAASRIVALCIAAGLTAWNGMVEHDAAFLAYGALSTAVLTLSAAVRRTPAVWVVDSLAVLSFVYVSGDWRSPYYLLWLSTLGLPAIMLTLRQSAWVMLAAPLAFFVVAVAGGPAPGELGPVSSETLAIHLALPFLIVAALSYVGDTLRRLRRERLVRERVEMEAERKRIAWDLHDSAKQRLHAAHLLISSLQGRLPREFEFPVNCAVIELESAASDMDTSLAELKSPLEGRPLEEALRHRARELAISGAVPITVRGHAPRLRPLVGAHVYRIGCEAMTNALRHACASRIDVRLDRDDGHFYLRVCDDGQGLPDAARNGGTGMASMENRAATIGADLTVSPASADSGTEVVLTMPIPESGDES